MFEDDFLAWGLATNTFLTREEASVVYAAKDDIPVISGGLDTTTADNRYAPKSGSLVYATKLELPDISGKANTTDVDAAFAGVASALAGKAATTHDHSGVYATAGHNHDTLYAPKTGSTEYATKTELTTGLSGKQATGAYLVAADIAGKANTTDVDAAFAGVATALAGKSDTTHTHAGVYATADHHHDLAYAPATGSTEYATKAELSTATGGGLTETSANALYARLDAMFTPVTDVTDVLYAPISGSTVYAAKTEIPDVSGKANTTDVATALAGKSDTNHTHAGVYATETQLNDVTAEVGMWAPADRNVPIDTQFAAISHNHDTLYAPTTGSTEYATKTELTTGLSGKQATGAYLVAADIAGKANTTDVTTALAGKSDTTHTHDYSALQTTANMVKVGSETTYYSGAKVDALLTGLGGSKPMYNVRLTGALSYLNNIGIWNGWARNNTLSTDNPASPLVYVAPNDNLIVVTPSLTKNYLAIIILGMEFTPSTSASCWFSLRKANAAYVPYVQGTSVQSTVEHNSATSTEVAAGHINPISNLFGRTASTQQCTHCCKLVPGDWFSVCIASNGTTVQPVLNFVLFEL